ncbi:MAG TPA: tetratricopeptide repeat protein [Kofleriaceae bacterium]|nr:tetratricopeptide repeat protein [Kofleriaceae bacterium]
MAPLTWDAHTPAPDVEAGGTEETPTFDAADFPDDEAAASAERTSITRPSAYDLRAQFTGRANAISELSRLLDRACDGGELAFATIVAEAGMGKSRALDELVAQVRASHPDVLVLAGAADEHAHAYGPVARALTAHFGLVAGEEPNESHDRIQRGIAEILPAARVTEAAHLVAHLLRVPYDDSPVVGPLLDTPQRLEARLFMALKRVLGTIAEQRPVIVAIENLELCEADTINFLHYLAAGLRDHKVAILTTATPELYQRHASFGDGDVAPHKVELGPLEPAEAEALMRELCKQLPNLPARLVTHARSLGGSPRAIQELVRFLLESDVIVREGVMWRIDPARLESTALPATYDELVAARLRVMDPTERRVLEMAAAIGETSWLDAVLGLERAAQVAAKGAPDPDGPTLAEIAASGDHSRLSVVAAVGKLVEREWLLDIAQSSMTGERELRFANGKLWQLVYKGIDEGKRRAYHGVVARWLELHPEGRTPEAQEEVARHYALAGDAREAATRFRRSAEAARAQYANEKAIRLFDRALACIGDADSSARIQLWHDLGSVYELIGDHEAALGAFERMLRLSWVSASKTKAAVAFNKMGRVWRRKGDLKLALEYLERGHELFRSAGDARGVAASLDDIGKTLHMLGRYDEAHTKIAEALARRGKRGDKRAIATSLSRLGDVQSDRGHYEAAYTCHKDALELRKQSGDRWGQIVSQNNLAALAFELGDLAEARAGWLAALPEAELIGALPLAALVLTNLGELALVENKLDEARRRLDNALEIIEDVEDRGLESECCRHLATLERLQGHPQTARELAERALDVARKAGLREKEAQAYLAIGEILSASLYDTTSDSGDAHDAAVAYGKAVDVLRSIHHDAQLGKALAAFGRYKAETGAIAEGKDMLRDAIAMFAKLGLSRPQAEVEKLLATLS